MSLITRKLYEQITLPTIALQKVTSKTGMGVYASSDTLYRGAVFGRDSLEVAEDLLTIKPRLVFSIIKTLASLQGSRYNKISEEEPGKIIHEYRNVVVDGKPINDISMKIFRDLSSKWGGNDKEMSYFGSVDSTPHYLRVVGKYATIKGKNLLNTAVSKRDGSVITLRESVEQAANWILKKINESKSGLVEYYKANPLGISNQVWKDSEEFYVHENGKRANHHLPIASIEVQALAYDGLLAAAELLDNGRIYYESAQKLRQKTIDLLWLEGQRRFALGTDYDNKKRLRLIKTMAANQAALLDSGFFDDIDSIKNKLYVSSIVKNIMSYEFLTDAGIRSRSLSAGNLVDHWDYHGTFVSWPKESYDFAKGLRRQGFEQLARAIENRIINVCLSYKAYPEFVYVDHAGRVLASPPSSHMHGGFTLVEGSNQPERIQAWSVSAILAILHGRIKNKLTIKKSKNQEDWKIELEQDILSEIPFVDRYINPLALKARYPSYKYKLKSKRQ